MIQRSQYNYFGALIVVAAGLLGCGGQATQGNIVAGAPTVSDTSPRSGELSASTSRRITATFSEPMNPASLTGASFSASSPAGPLTGTVSTSNSTATLLLNSDLPVNTVIVATITTAAKDMQGRPLAFNYVWQFTTGPTRDTTAPLVTNIEPADNSTGFGIDKRVVVVFSEAMAPESLNVSTFKLVGPSGPVSGKVTTVDTVSDFKPDADLAPSARYTATVTTGATDLSVNHLAADKVWTFTTGTNQDKTAPRLTAIDPDVNATGVPLNKNVTATYSEAMNVSTITTNSFTLKRPNGSLVPSSITYANKVAILNPTSPLDPNTTYIARVDGTITDTAGNFLENPLTWSFTTAAAGDNTPPTVTSTFPANNAVNVFLNQSINATFSEAMLANTINTSTFTVNGVQGTVSYDTGTRIATFKPFADLSPNTMYSARITTNVKDSAGNSMASNYDWSFTTGIQRSQNRIDLGSASSYAILAGSTVTNIGGTVVNGDLGISPGAALTGFPPGKVNGTIHAGDAKAAQAKVDLLAGQLDAAGRLGAAVLPGDLSGLTFTPGLYKNSTSVMLSAGTVTLDAQGDSDAVFIFQMGSSLTTSPGTQVILAGGARAGNVYWSVGTSATLGVNSVFKGNILAEASITVNTGATNDGTLLTKTGAVTLQSNTVTRTAPIRN